MSFTVNAVSSGSQVGGLSLPNYLTFVVSDSGAGGFVLINGVGVTSGALANAVDLATLFGAAAFHSSPLLKAFRAGPTTDTAAMNQFLANLDINIVPVAVTGIAFMPGVLYLATVSAVAGPFVKITGPGAPGDWRINMRLRHSITN